MWAGDLAGDDYRLSPINGPVSMVTSEISLFIGTHEVFFPDAQKFVQKAALMGKPVNYYEYPLMRHVFPLSSLPEAGKARAQILDLLDT